jgi:DNA-binding NtrC family response regulator
MDLLYRLQSGIVHLPPLRERREDIPLLADHFLKLAAEKNRREVVGFSPQALEFLSKRDYPGNIRELAQLVERGVLMCQSDTVVPQDLGDAPLAASLFERTLCSLKQNYDTHIVYVLTHTKGNRKAAAEILGITVRQLQRKIAELKGDPEWSDLVHDL